MSYFNVRSKADIDQLICCTGDAEPKNKSEKSKKNKIRKLRINYKQTGESIESVLKKQENATVRGICGKVKFSACVATATCFYRASYACALYAVVACPSVCLSQTGIVWKRLNVKSGRHRCMTGTLVFWRRWFWRNSTGVTPRGRQMQVGRKIRRLFDK